MRCTLIRSGNEKLYCSPGQCVRPEAMTCGALDAGGALRGLRRKPPRTVRPAAVSVWDYLSLSVAMTTIAAPISSFLALKTGMLIWAAKTPVDLSR